MSFALAHLLTAKTNTEKRESPKNVSKWQLTFHQVKRVDHLQSVYALSKRVFLIPTILCTLRSTVMLLAASLNLSKGTLALITVKFKNRANNWQKY